jgi:hypothetical protein
MELNKGFRFAVILAWEDLVKVSRPCSARVEYLCEPGAALDYVSVWSVRAGGRQDLVCDYWTWTSSAHPSGVRFRNGHRSEQLAQILDLIMKNQDQFTHPADACRQGLVLIHPPASEELAEATTWIKVFRGSTTNADGAPVGRQPLSIPSITDRTPESEAAVTWANA